MARATENRPRRKKIRIGRLLLCVVLLVFLVSTVSLFIRIERGISIQEELAEEYRVQLEAEKERAARLEDAEQQTLTDEYYEKIAREKLGLVNVNEQVFVDISKKNSAE